MEVTGCFKMSAAFQWTTRRYIPQDRMLLDHRCENLKSCNIPPIHSSSSFSVQLLLSLVSYLRGKEGKAVPVLNSISTTPRRRMGSGCIDPHFRDLGPSWRWVVSFTPRPLYPRYPLDRRLGGPQSQSGRSGEEKILDPIGTRTPTPRSSSP
jgi:hypothetical protein